MPCTIQVCTNSRRPAFCWKWTQRSVLRLLLLLLLLLSKSGVRFFHVMRLLVSEGLKMMCTRLSRNVQDESMNNELQHSKFFYKFYKIARNNNHSIAKKCGLWPVMRPNVIGVPVVVGVTLLTRVDCSFNSSPIAFTTDENVLTVV